MAAITDAAMLVLYNEALQSIALGQSYEINGRRMTRADLSAVQKMVEWLEARIEKASRTQPGLGLASLHDPV